MTFTDDMSLGEARAVLRGLVEHGHPCPCCQQLAKIYRRRIHRTMAVKLIGFYRDAGMGWFDLPVLDPRGGDTAKLRYWGLLEPDTVTVRDDGSKRNGRWRVTPLGEVWVVAGATVLSHAWIYNGECFGLTGDPVTITDCLGDAFDYDDLMAGV